MISNMYRFLQCIPVKFSKMIEDSSGENNGFLSIKFCKTPIYNALQGKH